MTVIDKVRVLMNDQIGGINIERFIELARERAELEIPYRAASLFALSIGDDRSSREFLFAGAISTVNDIALERLVDALRPFGNAWNPINPARSWSGVSVDDYRRASEALAIWRKDRGGDPPQAE